MTDLEILIAKDQIASRIYQLFISTDQRDWAEVRRCFADAASSKHPDIARAYIRFLMAEDAARNDAKTGLEPNRQTVENRK